MFTESYGMAKIWNQPECPPTDEWIKDVVHVYNGMLFSLKMEEKSVTPTTCKNLEELC
jgi:hypothetical protein